MLYCRFRDGRFRRWYGYTSLVSNRNVFALDLRSIVRVIIRQEDLDQGQVVDASRLLMPTANDADQRLSPDEWHILEETAQFLQPFYRATLETEGDEATIDRTLYTMDILIKHFNRSKVRSLQIRSAQARL